MPLSANARVKFRCENCEKPLSIGRRKIGVKVTCPRCKSSIVVPAESDVPQPSPNSQNPFDEFAVYDDEFDEPELVYEDEKPTAATKKLNQRLSIPRRAVYIQGALLGIVAVFFFMLGLLIGNSGGSGNPTRVTMTKVIGAIRLNEGDAVVLDEGAVVFLFPTGKRPDTKFDAEELQPGRMFTNANPEVSLIRKFGGNVCTANRNGDFQMLVEPGREYILMVISASGTRTAELSSEYYEELGQYFTSLDILAGNQACFYKRILPQRETENLGTVSINSRG